MFNGMIISGYGEQQRTKRTPRMFEPIKNGASFSELLPCKICGLVDYPPKMRKVEGGYECDTHRKSSPFVEEGFKALDATIAKINQTYGQSNVGKMMRIADVPIGAIFCHNHGSQNEWLVFKRDTANTRSIGIKGFVGKKVTDELSDDRLVKVLADPVVGRQWR